MQDQKHVYFRLPVWIVNSGGLAESRTNKAIQNTIMVLNAVILHPHTIEDLVEVICLQFPLNTYHVRSFIVFI